MERWLGELSRDLRGKTYVPRQVRDRRELVADVDTVPAPVGRAEEVLADNGCATGDEVAQLEQLDTLSLTGSGPESPSLSALRTAVQLHSQPRRTVYIRQTARGNSAPLLPSVFTGE